MFRRVSFLFAAAAVLTASLALPARAEAQSGVGIKGGFLYTSLEFDEVDDVYDSRTGWTAGFFFGAKRPVTIQGELNLLQKRVRDTISDEDVSLYYVQVPVLLRVGGGDSVHLYGIVGPAFDIKVGESDDLTIVDEWEGIDIGIMGGVGLEISHFIVEGRANWGLRNIAKNFTNFDGGDLKGRTVSLQVGFRF
jgi:hypothetical protein